MPDQASVTAATYSPDAHQMMAARTATRDAGFFLPYLHPDMSLLDCGCGQGTITLGLAEIVAPGEVVGIDIDPDQIERARALAAERGAKNVRFEVADIYALPFPDGSFDAVFGNQLLLWLSDPRSGAHGVPSGAEARWHRRDANHRSRCYRDRSFLTVARPNARSATTSLADDGSKPHGRSQAASSHVGIRICPQRESRRLVWRRNTRDR